MRLLFWLWMQTTTQGIGKTLDSHDLRPQWRKCQGEPFCFQRRDSIKAIKCMIPLDKKSVPKILGYS